MKITASKNTAGIAKTLYSDVAQSKYSNYVHGGQLNKIAKIYQIPLTNWVDLSTGINPYSYPTCDVPQYVWNRLPENTDQLPTIAAQYYQCGSLIAVAGSQIAIQIIPTLFSKCTVGLIQPGYYEHEKCWASENHTIVKFNQHSNKILSSAHDIQSNNYQDTQYSLVKQINAKIHQLNVLVLINPNNPSGLCFSKSQLKKWQAILAKNNGYLIIDEAFIDVDSTNSLLSNDLFSNLIVLRSIGKFFGLAGARLGFVFSNKVILDKISSIQGPWPISGPSRWLACKALADTEWQIQTRSKLIKASNRLKSLLSRFQLRPAGSTELFQWVITSKANDIYHSLNQQAIFTRLFHEPSSLRFGLPKDESHWQRLESALSTISKT